ncbi:MAG: orotate phosphoribosyltransferase [Thermoanaerobaculia bacterium]
MESNGSLAPQDALPHAPSQKTIRRLLESSGALKQGHFVLSSGRHSGSYVQCALLLREPAQARQVGAWLAAMLVQHRPESVVSPALGAVLIGYEVATALGVRFQFTERGEDGRMALRRGFHLESGERVVVIEDVVTTGKSTAEVIDLVEGQAGRVIGVGSIINRSERDDILSRPHAALTRLRFETFDSSDCPLCAAGLPVEKPGSRMRSLA